MVDSPGLFRDPMYTTMVYNNLSNSDDELWLSAVPHTSLTKIKSTNITRYGEPSVVKSIAVGRDPDRFVWFKQRLSDRLKDEDTLSSIIEKSKLHLSDNHAIVLDVKNSWDSFIVVMKVSERYLKELKITLNGIKLSLREKWLTKVADHNLIFGLSPSKERGKLTLRVVISKCISDTPSLLMIHDKIFVLKSGYPVRMLRESSLPTYNNTFKEDMKCQAETI